MAEKKKTPAKPVTCRETITPEIARKYLECNYSNRAVRSSWVEELVGKIQRGQWEFTHQGIAFDVTGRLVDGQHRLMAIARAGMPCDVLVTRDLADGVYRHIDSGKVRSLADRVHLTTESAHHNAIAVSIMRAYVLATCGKRPAPQELIENQFLAMSDEVMMVVDSFRSRQRHLTTGPIGAAIACYATKHPNRAREFMKSLLAGTGLEEGSSVLTLREAAMNGRLGSSNLVHEQYWKSIQATRYFHERKPLPRLSMAHEDWRGNEPKRHVEQRVAIAKSGWESRREAQKWHARST